MALIKCPECGREISDQAPSCPSCGIVIKKVNENEIKNYPTISPLSRTDMTRYSDAQMRNRKVKCQVCGIEYDSKMYKSCPLCEMRQQQLRQSYNNNVANGTSNVTQTVRQTGHSDIQSVNRVNESILNVPPVHRPVNSSLYEKGGIIKFGMFDGKPVAWQILDINPKDNEILILSVEGLELRRYHSKQGEANWYKCDLRKYLNGEFLEKTFNEQERKVIVEKVIKSESTENCKISRDKIFVLSKSEAGRLLPDEKLRRCKASGYLRKHKEFLTVHKLWGTCDWWLRDRGESTNKAACVYMNGFITQLNDVMTAAVRPAMWVKMI